MTPGSYILGRAKQMGLSITQLAGLLHMTYPTLHQRLAGRSDWRAGEIKALAELLQLPRDEIYALTVEQTIPARETAPAQSAAEAWQENHDGYPPEDDPMSSLFRAST